MRNAVLVLALVLIAACDPICATHASVTGTSWKLTFTGPAAGNVTLGTSDCQASTGSKHFQYMLTTRMNGKDLLLTITIYSNFTGEGTYNVGTVLDGAAELRLSIGDYLGATTSGAGSVTVNRNGSSGSVDANLPEGEHVSGSWECSKYEQVIG